MEDEPTGILLDLRERLRKAKEASDSTPGHDVDSELTYGFENKGIWHLPAGEVWLPDELALSLTYFANKEGVNKYLLLGQIIRDSGYLAVKEFLDDPDEAS